MVTIMRKLFAALAGLVAMLCIGFTPLLTSALAQKAPAETSVAAPTEVAAVVVPGSDTVVVTEDTSVVIPYGTWLSALGDLITNYAMPLLLTVAAGFVATLPGYAKVLVGTFLTEQNMRRAIQYALNQVAGAAAGKQLSIDVGNRVIAVAAQYFVDSVPAWLTRWLGGEAAIPDKVLSRITLEEQASAERVVLRTPQPKVKGATRRHRP